MLQDILNKVLIGNETYGLDFDFAEVTAVQPNSLLTCNLTQRLGIYEDCLILGEFYYPKIKDKGIILFVGKRKYPCFYSFSSGSSFVNSSETTMGTTSTDFTVSFDNIPVEFLNRTKEIAVAVGIPYEWLLVLMYFESGLDPSAINDSSGATGLIQWLDPRPAEIGTTITALRSMDALQQLEFVYKDFIRARGRLKTIYDVMMWVFYPAYVGKNPDTLFPDNVVRANNGISSPRVYTDRALNTAKPYINYVGGTITLKNNGAVILEGNQKLE